MKNKIELFAQYIDESMQIVLLSHYNPDGDAIGSMLAMYAFLQEKQKKVSMICPNVIPSFLRWMEGAEQILDYSRKPSKCDARIAEADLIISMDFNSISRLRGFEEKVQTAPARKVLIDHHPDPESFNDLVFSNTGVSSTAEYLYQVLSLLDPAVSTNSRIATGILTGMMTDTGCFSHNSSEGDTFRVVGELLDTGIDKDEIYDKVYNTYSASRMQLMGHVLKERMVVMPGYHAAYISLSLADQRAYHFKSGDSEGFVNLPLAIEGIRFAALFIEKKGFVKASFRSKGSFDANTFSRMHFYGGGHQRAAGGECKLPLTDCCAKFETLIQQYARELQNA